MDADGKLYFNRRTKAPMMGPPASNITFIAGDVLFHHDGMKVYPAGMIMLIVEPQATKKRKATTRPVLVPWAPNEAVKTSPECATYNLSPEKFSKYGKTFTVIGVGVLHDDVLPRVAATEEKPIVYEAASVIVHGVCNILPIYIKKLEGDQCPRGAVNSRFLAKASSDGKDHLLSTGGVGPHIHFENPMRTGSYAINLVSSYVKDDNFARVMVNSAAIYNYVCYERF